MGPPGIHARPGSRCKPPSPAPQATLEEDPEEEEDEEGFEEELDGPPPPAPVFPARTPSVGGSIMPVWGKGIRRSPFTALPMAMVRNDLWLCCERESPDPRHCQGQHKWRRFSAKVYII